MLECRDDEVYFWKAAAREHRVGEAPGTIMAPPDGGGPREHRMEDVHVPLVGPAPVVHVNRRQHQGLRSCSALAAAMVLAGTVAIVLTGSSRGVPSLAETGTTSPATLTDARAPASAPQAPTLREMLKTKQLDHRRCESV